MKTWQAYSAWCRRHAATAQCNPVIVGPGAVIIFLIIFGVRAELRAHMTGFTQLVQGVMAAMTCAAAAGLIWGVRRIMAEPELPPAPEPAYESPVIRAARGCTEDELAAEAAAGRVRFDRDGWERVPERKPMCDAGRAPLHAAADAAGEHGAGQFPDDAQPVPVPAPADEAPEIPAGAPSMAEEADRLAEGLLDVVVSPRGTVWELADDAEPGS